MKIAFDSRNQALSGQVSSKHQLLLNSKNSGGIKSGLLDRRSSNWV